MRKEVEVEIKGMEKATGVKAEKREENVEIEVTANDAKEIKKYRVKIIENGKEEILEWNGEGEMPEKMKKVVGDSEVIVKTKGAKESQQFKIVNAEEMGIDQTSDLVVKNNNKGQIGVMITSAKGGVEITKFTNSSTAKAAGLQLGDIIIGVNDMKVVTIQDLVKSLSPYEPDDVVSINYTRGEKILKSDVKLDSRN